MNAPRPAPTDPASPAGPGGAWRSRALLVAIWSASMWTAVIARLVRGKAPWFVDYNSVVCGAERVNAKLPLYGPGATCPHLAMSTYVYPPWIAQAFAPVVRALGERLAFWAYVVLFVIAFGFLLYKVFVARMRASSRLQRLPFLALVSGNPFVVGNVAIVAQGAIVLAASLLGAESVALTLTVALASLVKPIYLTFLAIPAFAPARPLRRVLLVGVAAGVVCALAASDLPQMAQWRSFVISVSVDPSPGGGFLRWLSDAGVHDHLVTAVLYLAYAGPLFLAGLVIAERGGLDRTGRFWLGASVAVLLLPRLVAYDLLILGPGLAAAANAPALSERAGRALRRLWTLACAVYLVSSLLGGPLKVGHALAAIVLAAGVVVLGARLAWDGRVRPARSPAQEPAVPG